MRDRASTASIPEFPAPDSPFDSGSQDHERCIPEILHRAHRRTPDALPGNGQNRILEERHVVESAMGWDDPVDRSVHPPFAQSAVELDRT